MALEAAGFVQRNIVPGSVALAAGLVGAGVLAFANGGAGVVMAAATGISIATFSGLHALRFHASYKALLAAHRHLGEEIDDLRERQAQQDVKMSEIERRTIESPALVWRAATADIEVMGSLINDLAKSVADHEKRLGRDASPGQHSQAASMSTEVQLPVHAYASEATEWFEDEAELGFTVDSSLAIAVPSLLSAETIAPHMASAALVLELRTTLASALSSDRLELCLQPVVTLPQRKPRGYEASLRLKGENGDVQTDADLRRIAVATGLEAELDKVLVERAVQVLRVLRARNKETVVCCAIDGASLRHADFMTRLENLVRSDEKLARAVMLEISHASYRSLESVIGETVASLQRLGVALGLRNLPDLRIDVADLLQRRILQVRVTADMLANATEAGGSISDIHPADLAELLQRKGIDLLVSGVSSEQTVVDLLDQGVPMAQGQVFGPARPVRPEILAPKAVSTPAAGTAPTTVRKSENREPDGSTTRNAKLPRQSFRSLLRRA